MFVNILDGEVFAVIVAISIVGSALGIAQLLRPEVVEPFTALGLLNQDCAIGEYPKYVFAGGEIELCVFVGNNMGYPILARVVYKLGTGEDLPTNTTPSTLKPIKNFTVLVAHGGNVTFKVRLPIPENPPEADRVAIILELWFYDPERGVWTYSGRWNHLYVQVVRV